MSVHSVDPLAMFAKRNAEENFKLQDIKGAIVCATMAKTLDPDVDGIDETLIAYKIYHAISKKRGKNGAPNWWYEVLGIRENFEDIDSIKKQYNKLVDMVNPTNNASVATWDALTLITKAWSNVCDPNKREVTISNYVNFRRKKGSGGTKVSKVKCPRCGKWCKYEVSKDSNSRKHRNHPKAKNVLLITCSGTSGCRFKFDPIIPTSDKTPNSRLFDRVK